MVEPTDGKPPSLQTNLMNLTNRKLVSHGFRQPRTTVLENELLHRLEVYVELYGDYLEVETRRH